MKLLMCDECDDVFNLDFHEKSCKCGKTKGKYLDNQNAICSGDTAMLMGFSNPSLRSAIKNKKSGAVGFGLNFTAFIIDDNCRTFIKK